MTLIVGSGGHTQEMRSRVELLMEQILRIDPSWTPGATSEVAGRHFAFVEPEISYADIAAGRISPCPVEQPEIKMQKITLGVSKNTAHSISATVPRLTPDNVRSDSSLTGRQELPSVRVEEIPMACNVAFHLATVKASAPSTFTFCDEEVQSRAVLPEKQSLDKAQSNKPEQQPGERSEERQSRSRTPVSPNVSCLSAPESLGIRSPSPLFIPGETASFAEVLRSRTLLEEESKRGEDQKVALPPKPTHVMSKIQTNEGQSVRGKQSKAESGASETLKSNNSKKESTNAPELHMHPTIPGLVIQSEESLVRKQKVSKPTSLSKKGNIKEIRNTHANKIPSIAVETTEKSEIGPKEVAKNRKIDAQPKPPQPELASTPEKNAPKSPKKHKSKPSPVVEDEIEQALKAIEALDQAGRKKGKGRSQCLGAPHTTNITEVRKVVEPETSGKDLNKKSKVQDKGKENAQYEAPTPGSSEGSMASSSHLPHGSKTQEVRDKQAKDARKTRIQDSLKSKPVQPAEDKIKCESATTGTSEASVVCLSTDQASPQLDTEASKTSKKKKAKKANATNNDTTKVDNPSQSEKPDQCKTPLNAPPLITSVPTRTDTIDALELKTNGADVTFSKVGKESKKSRVEKDQQAKDQRCSPNACREKNNKKKGETATLCIGEPSKMATKRPGEKEGHDNENKKKKKSFEDSSLSSLASTAAVYSVASENQTDKQDCLTVNREEDKLFLDDAKPEDDDLSEGPILVVKASLQRVEAPTSATARQNIQSAVKQLSVAMEDLADKSEMTKHTTEKGPQDFIALLESVKAAELDCVAGFNSSTGIRPVSRDFSSPPISSFKPPMTLPSTSDDWLLALDEPISLDDEDNVRASAPPHSPNIGNQSERDSVSPTKYIPPAKLNVKLNSSSDDWLTALDEPITLDDEDELVAKPADPVRTEIRKDISQEVQIKGQSCKALEMKLDNTSDDWLAALDEPITLDDEDDIKTDPPPSLPVLDSIKSSVQQIVESDKAKVPLKPFEMKLESTSDDWLAALDEPITLDDEDEIKTDPTPILPVQGSITSTAQQNMESVPAKLPSKPFEMKLNNTSDDWLAALDEPITLDDEDDIKTDPPPSLPVLESIKSSVQQNVESDKAKVPSKPFEMKLESTSDDWLAALDQPIMLDDEDEIKTDPTPILPVQESITSTAQQNMESVPAKMPSKPFEMKLASTSDDWLAALDEPITLDDEDDIKTDPSPISLVQGSIKSSAQQNIESVTTKVPSKPFEMKLDDTSDDWLAALDEPITLDDEEEIKTDTPPILPVQESITSSAQQNMEPVTAEVPSKPFEMKLDGTSDDWLAALDEPITLDDEDDIKTDPPSILPVQEGIKSIAQQNLESHEAKVPSKPFHMKLDSTSDDWLAALDEPLTLEDECDNAADKLVQESEDRSVEQRKEPESSKLSSKPFEMNVHKTSDDWLAALDEPIILDNEDDVLADASKPSPNQQSIDRSVESQTEKTSVIRSATHQSKYPDTESLALPSDETKTTHRNVSPMRRRDTKKTKKPDSSTYATTGIFGSVKARSKNPRKIIDVNPLTGEVSIIKSSDVKLPESKAPDNPTSPVIALQGCPGTSIHEPALFGSYSRASKVKALQADSESNKQKKGNISNSNEILTLADPKLPGVAEINTAHQNAPYFVFEDFWHEKWLCHDAERKFYTRLAQNNTERLEMINYDSTLDTYKDPIFKHDVCGAEKEKVEGTYQTTDGQDELFTVTTMPEFGAQLTQNLTTSLQEMTLGLQPESEIVPDTATSSPLSTSTSSVTLKEKVIRDTAQLAAAVAQSEEELQKLPAHSLTAMHDELERILAELMAKDTVAARVQDNLDCLTQDEETQALSYGLSEVRAHVAELVTHVLQGRAAVQNAEHRGLSREQSVQQYQSLLAELERWLSSACQLVNANVQNIPVPELQQQLVAHKQLSSELRQHQVKLQQLSNICAALQRHPETENLAPNLLTQLESIADTFRELSDVVPSRIAALQVPGSYPGISLA